VGADLRRQAEEGGESEGVPKNLNSPTKKTFSFSGVETKTGGKGKKDQISTLQQIPVGGIK